MTKLEKVIGYCDGCCKGRLAGGWGCVVYRNVGNDELSNYAPVEFINYAGSEKTTNQIMELTGMIEVLNLCPKPADITIFSDSGYVLGTLINGGKKGTLTKNPPYFTGWMRNWNKKGWRPDLKNQKLLRLLERTCIDHLKAGSKINLNWVKGHSKNVGNDYADKLANRGYRLTKEYKNMVK